MPPHSCCIWCLIDHCGDDAHDCVLMAIGGSSRFHLSISSADGQHRHRILFIVWDSIWKRRKKKCEEKSIIGAYTTRRAYCGPTWLVGWRYFCTNSLFFGLQFKLYTFSLLCALVYCNGPGTGAMRCERFCCAGCLSRMIFEAHVCGRRLIMIGCRPCLTLYVSYINETLYVLDTPTIVNASHLLDSIDGLWWGLGWIGSSRLNGNDTHSKKSITYFIVIELMNWKTRRPNQIDDRFLSIYRLG